MSDSYPAWSEMYPMYTRVYRLGTKDAPNIHTDGAAITRRINRTAKVWMTLAGERPADAGMGFLIPHLEQDLSDRIYPKNGRLVVEMLGHREHKRAKGFTAFFRLWHGPRGGEQTEIGRGKAVLIYMNLDNNKAAPMPTKVVEVDGRMRAV